MAFTDRISLIVDIVTGQSVSSVSKLRAELAQTDGAFNKLKVAGSGAMRALSQFSGAILLGAGTAIAAFGAQSVASFQETALGAGKLRDSLGLTAEEASRFQEVAGDLGIGVQVLEKSMGRMLRTAHETPEAFDAIGAAIARNADGSVNVQQTFLNVVEALNRIPDATRRASAAQEIFGRGWMDIAEMIEMGASGMAAALASVEGGKIIDDAEIDKARQFRDTLDELKGVGEEAATMLGGFLVDGLSQVGTAATAVIDKVKSLGDAIGSIPGSDVLKWVNPLTAGIQVWDKAGDVIDNVSGKITGTLAPGIVQTHEASKAAAAESAAAAEEASRRQVQAMDAYKQAIGITIDQLEALADAERSRIEAARSAADAGFALRDAQRDFAQSVMETQTVLSTEGVTMGEIAASQDQLAQSAGKVADSYVRVQTEVAASNGVTLTATDQQRLWTTSMLETAGTVSGPMQSAIVGYIASVNGIPPEVVTMVLANGADPAAQALELMRLAAEGVPPSVVTDASAPGAIETAVALTGVTQSANTIPPAKSTSVSTPGAVESAVTLTGVTDQANTIPPAKSTNVTAPGAIPIAGQLGHVRDQAESIPPTRHTTVGATDNATGTLARIRDAVAAIRDRVVTVTTRHVISGGAGFVSAGGIFKREHTGGRVPAGNPMRRIGTWGHEELWQPDNGLPGSAGRIHSHEDMRRMERDAARMGGGGVSIVVNAPGADGESIARTLRLELWKQRAQQAEARRTEL